MWGLSNIACDREDTASKVVNHPIFKTTLKFLVSTNHNLSSEATFVVCNSLDAIDSNKVQHVLTPHSKDILKPMLKNLKAKTPKIVLAVLEMVERLFKLDDSLGLDGEKSFKW